MIFKLPGGDYVVKLRFKIVRTRKFAVSSQHLGASSLMRQPTLHLGAITARPRSFPSTQMSFYLSRKRGEKLHKKCNNCRVVAKLKYFSFVCTNWSNRNWWNCTAKCRGKLLFGKAHNNLSFARLENRIVFLLPNVQWVSRANDVRPYIIVRITKKRYH